MKYEARDSEIVWEKMGDESLLIDLKAGIYYSFQKGHAQALELLLDGSDSDWIVDNVGQDVRAQVEAGVRRLVEFLEQENLVKQAPDREGQSPETPLNFQSLDFPTIERLDDLKEIFELDPIHEGDEERGWPVAR